MTASQKLPVRSVLAYSPIHALIVYRSDCFASGNTESDCQGNAQQSDRNDLGTSVCKHRGRHDSEKKVSDGLSAGDNNSLIESQSLRTAIILSACKGTELGYYFDVCLTRIRD
jgi:hypothetical protein